MITEDRPQTGLNSIAQIIFNCKEEAYTAKRNRMVQNRDNFESYHLRQDYSHKQRGQSKEFIAKQQNAVEQITSFLQQGLMDQGDWFRIESQPGITNPLVLPKEMEKLTLRQLEKNKFPLFMSDSIKVGLLGSLMVVKVSGKVVTKCNYRVESVVSPGETAEAISADYASVLKFGKTKKKLYRIEKDIWELSLALVRQEDYYPDPTGRGMYEIQQIEMDYHELVAMAEANPDDFDMDAIERIGPSTDELQKNKKARESGQNVTIQASRKPVTLLEYWGDFVDPATGKLLHKNSVAMISIDGQEVRPPKKNPLWHGESPYVVSPIVRVPHSVWHRAMMDAATKHNQSLNELYNLMLDAGMMSVFGIRQLRTDWLQNQDQVSNGIPPGETLVANSSCPPGGKILERVDTAALSADSLQMYNLTDREFQQSAMTNDTRLGSLPQRAVKATEIVASNQSITGVFNGIVKIVEEEFVAKILEKSWKTMAQHMNDLDEDEVKALIGEDRANILSNLSPEDLFAGTVSGSKYKVFGLSTTLNKIQDFRKITALLQSIGQSPQMMSEFQRKYSITKLVGEIVKSLDIDEQKIILTDQEKAVIENEKQQMMAAMAQGQKGGGAPNATAGGQGTNPQSQIPQAAATSSENGGVEIPRGVNNQGMTSP